MEYKRYKDICTGKGHMLKMIQTDNSINTPLTVVTGLVTHRYVERICMNLQRLLLFINCYGVRVFAWMSGESLSSELLGVPSYANAFVRSLQIAVAGSVGLAGLGGIDRQALLGGSDVTIKVIFRKLNK